ncbi:protocatechuate 3,4-dioxygenase subunit alpha [Noviherbaspirillum cavernae]|uniref:Protocatechuate 3,4-dioxygenase subunit alpha n=1 Tax=Noviherbaspirillum cavernae TaxID=2320862 RepID=A0A418X2S8_9BURK|nr:protocatechuate 3,4-dioxygenase subunit alpha [Noviherbaspirillum cavernae]RJG06691.1 protocatechuate 3,4-dioxygenase subunit alpha [Noviherbaspirillum cavernae]
MSLQMTASQTVGPYLHIGLDGLNTDNLVGEGVTGERIVLQGRVFDGNGKIVPDGMIEIWQANAHGKYAHPDDTRELPVEAGFKGFGRISTDAEGGFRFTTIKPGRVPGPGGALQAPHIVVSVFARGLTKRLATRVYFADEASNADDPILKLVPAERRATLIAKRTGDGVYEWNVAIQGDSSGNDETVFFDV